MTAMYNKLIIRVKIVGLILHAYISYLSYYYYHFYNWIKAVIINPNSLNFAYVHTVYF